MSAWPADTAPAGAVALLVGAGLGWVVGTGVPRLMRAEGEPDEATRGSAPWRWAVAGALAGGAVWWWEAVARGLDPVISGPAGADGPALAARCLGHLGLFALLAAATWIDLRLRVIPDAITVPGVLVALVTAWLVPARFLPVAVEVPRSFAAPALVADVLVAEGGLATSPTPAWLAARPALAGLATALAILGCWWWGCTPGGLGPRAERVRAASGVVLLAAALFAWWCGGQSHTGLMAALVGIAVGGGLVYATRAGASLAMGREAMGFGDVTLMAMVGAWLGWQAAVFVFFLGVFLGLGHGLVQIVLHGEAEMPFGPSLCLACSLAVIGWRTAWRLTEPAFANPVELGIFLGLVVGSSAFALAGLQWWRGRGG